MSVKRLSYLKLLLGYTTGRLKEMQKDWSHAQKKAYEDILRHADGLTLAKSFAHH